MARYIHKLLKPTYVIQHALQVPVRRANGVTDMVNEPGHPKVEVQFDSKPISHAERTHAYEFFLGREGTAAFGALPYEKAGTSEQLGDKPYDGVDPEFRLSVLDTNDPQQVASQHRELVESKLEAENDFGKDFIRVDEAKTPKPWPSYDEITGAGADKKIAAMARNGGFPIAGVVAYEQENQNRDAVVRALEAAKVDLVDAAREAEALSGTL